MESIEKLKKQLQCEKCHSSYSNWNVAYLHDSCRHHTCSDCSSSASNHDCRCPVCFCESKPTYIPFVGGVLNNLKSCETSISKFGEVEATLREENAILKREKLLLETPPDHHRCIECDELYSEKDMQLCETCHELKFEDHEDVEKHALCAGCAIKKHIRQGHKTVDFFPYLSAYNLSAQSPMINSKSKEFKNARDLLSNLFSAFNSLSTTVSQKYDVLTDMARRSKNAKQQVKFFEKMETFIDESKSITAKANSELKEHATELESKIETITKWYETEMDNCVDESELVKLPISDDSDDDKTEVDV